jgi:acetylornithine/LysW-gamma-L-lysine aminotransferase
METAIDYRELQARYEFDVYPKRDVVLVRGQGSRLWDSDSKEYLDCAGGHGVVSLGHCNPVIVEAVRAQSERLITCPGTYYNDVKARLLEKLASVAPAGLDRAFLCNSGTEAIEGAIKFARMCTGRTKFVCAQRSFHGRTMGSLSATFNPDYRKPFEPLVPGFYFVPYNNLDALSAAVTEETAAVMLEVVQGEGGVHVGTTEFLAGARNICDQRGALLIIDEIQSGFCRTGRMFACMHSGISPDICCVAKAIAGGLPMGAVLCSQRLEAQIGKHGSTFGGNPLCCAAAIAAIDFMLEHRLDEQAAAKGAYLADRIRQPEIAVVREVRGLGLMIGVELRTRARPYVQALLDRGLIVLPTGATVIRLLPPLVIEMAEIDAVVERLVDGLRSSVES